MQTKIAKVIICQYLKITVLIEFLKHSRQEITHFDKSQTKFFQKSSWFSREKKYTIFWYARVMKLVDMLDSKSGGFTAVWVRVPSLVKLEIGFKSRFLFLKEEKSDFFSFFYFLKNVKNLLKFVWKMWKIVFKISWKMWNFHPKRFEKCEKIIII